MWWPVRAITNHCAIANALQVFGHRVMVVPAVLPHHIPHFVLYHLVHAIFEHNHRTRAALFLLVFAVGLSHKLPVSNCVSRLCVHVSVERVYMVCCGLHTASAF